MARLDGDAALKAQVDAASIGAAASPVAQDWYSRLAAFIRDIEAGIPSKLQDAGFLRELWDNNPVAATGMGSVKMAPALTDSGFCDWFAGEIQKPLPADPVEAEAHLTGLYNALVERLKALCGRAPRLKINRVLCAIYPKHFTTIADPGALLFLHQEMGGARNDHPVRAHKAILNRIEAVLGPVPGDSLDALVRRICLPWMVYERISNDESAEKSPPEPPTGDMGLKPLQAALRRKGLTAMKGGFQTLLGYLTELKEGATKEEFADIIKQSNPDLAASSLLTSINVVSREFDLCKREGDSYRLSARGLNLLETQDPDELADHLLTKVLGIDHVLKALESGPKTKGGLVAMLQTVNPGWTSDFGPTAQLWWLTSLDVIKPDSDKRFALTERGKRWAELVTWTPQSLPKPVESVEETTALDPTKLQLPEFSEIWKQLTSLVAGKLVLKRALVAQLHAGLWFHSVRHFVVLTGISGSGKTQLAEKYALALCSSNANVLDRVRIIPVQPGWYDPSPLLGYVNPLQESSYRSAPFLDLLLRAAANPEQPYVAILDELNLSHPEQYLAPVLSAMETHGWLDLHHLSEEATSVPRRVQYPANLAIIGTLNMDETTHGLSDKVLDRAYTLEFWDIGVDDFPGWESVKLPPEFKDKIKAVLTGLAQALAPVRLHFGWRTIADVLGYLSFQADMGGDDDAVLDDVIYAKVLPKLRGETSKKFQKALEDAKAVLVGNGLSRCAEKVASLQEDLVTTGSARFWR